MFDYIYFGLCVLGFIFVWRWLIRERVRSGRLSIGRKTYDYRLGDKLRSESDSVSDHLSIFKGIDIVLEKKMPHIYLDSHHDSKFVGPRFHISRKNKISLEGNFDSYFQLYAAENYEQLALSIITPDVMIALMGFSHRYDVEIKGHHLRLISQENVYKITKREAALLAAAQTVLEQVAHRQKSWRVHEITDVQETQLTVITERSVKVGRRAVRLAWFVCICIGAIFLAIWLLVTSGSFYADGVSPVSGRYRFAGVIGSLLSPFLLVFLLELWKKRSPRTYQEFMSYFHN